MSVEIRVPQLPESVTDAKLMSWRKQAGEAVSRDENLADLETDKVVLDVPAPINGVLREIKAQAGATVRSGELLAIIAPENLASQNVGRKLGFTFWKQAPVEGDLRNLYHLPLREAAAPSN